MKFRRIGLEMQEMSKIPPGIALYSLRTEFKSGSDLIGILKKVAEMGYRTIEFFTYENIPACRMKQVLDTYGLKAISSIFPFEHMEKELSQLIKYSQTIGSKYLTCYIPSGSEELFTDPLKFQTLISRFRKVGMEIKRNHLQFAFHPEHSEFQTVDGQINFGRLLDSVGRDLLSLELDMFWVKKEGLDPIATLLAYRNSVPLVHVKDLDQIGDSTEIGHGIIDWPPIFRILREAGVKYYFVEQDYSANPLQSVKTSLGYLKSIGVA